MNTQPPVHSKPLANGFGRRRGEREMGTRPEIKSLPGKPNFSSKVPNSGNRSVGYGSPSRDRLVYVSTCLIGHQVEVQVKSGAVYSGIFHSTNAEKDIGAVLKMARMIKGGKADVEPASKVPIKTLIIPAKDLVQVTAKDVSITRDGFSADAQNEKQAELMIDSYISQSRPGEMERELEPWIPDADDLQRPELENVFDSKWNRGWNQFEANAALFGVTSTFDEELYTTKLDRGPQMRERERVAQRIAREIEGEETHDLHLAEERGFQLGDKFDVDEETRYSSVSRGKIIDGYVESEDTLLDSCNDETFGDSSTSSIKSSSDWTKGKSNDVVRASSSSPTMDQAQSSQSSAALSISRSDSYDRTGHLASESPFKSSSTMTSERRRPENQLSEHGGINETNVYSEKKPSAEGTPMSNSDESSSALTGKKDGTDKEASHNAIFSASSRVPTKVNEKLNSSGELVEDSAAGKPPHGRPGSSTSSRSEYMAPPSTSSGHGLSPTSSVASIASEKSSLNPYAKEFKLNANAKSYVPSHSPVRPPSPITDGSYYFQPNMPSVQQIPGMHVGMAAQFGQQPVVYNAQAAPPQAPPQAYFHPNGPQYAPQMFAHPRQVVYMPGYHQQLEAQYRGRDY